MPVLGPVPLRSIRRSHVMEVVRRCSRDLGLGPLVTRYTVATLRAILAAAVAERLIPTNVAADKTIPLPKRERASGTLSAEQVAAIATRIEPRYRAMVLLGAASGLRPGELMAVTADRISPAIHLAGDVIPQQATVRVDRQATVGHAFAPPKTASSVREVAVGATVVRTLIEHVRTFGLGDEGLVFSTPTGRMLSSPYTSVAWTRATAGMDLPPGLTLHDLRHHHASTLLSEGINIAAVAKRLGHSSPTITLAHYSWAMPQDDDLILRASEAIARRLA
ncbi:MAG: site-specific integrase [Acidobacteria bacterium]|nr:MAG: site-specific integrase [Acidobacteriota bacterium]